MILLAMINGYARKIKNEYIEPNTSGIDKNKSNVKLFFNHFLHKYSNELEFIKQHVHVYAHLFHAHCYDSHYLLCEYVAIQSYFLP